MEQGPKKPYVKPMVLATYSKEELEEVIKPHGPTDSYTSDGCAAGCGCGCGIGI
jgi:hypothetical protein